MINLRVVCPSSSFKDDDKTKIKKIINKLKKLNIKVSFGKYVYKKDEDYKGASINDRVEDLSNAFLDNSVDIVICGRGGFNSNQILPFINYKVIKRHPKMFCGMSDNAALLMAIFSKTGVKTLLGPNFIDLDNAQNLNNFLKIIKNKKSCIYAQKINDCDAIGTIIAGNLCTINLLQGTEFFAKHKDVILFVEDDDNYKPGAFFREFDRNLESLLQTGLDIKALVLGKFEKSACMSIEKILKMIDRNQKLKKIPVVINVSFGHVFPIETIPIGGNCKINSNTINIEF